MKSILTNILIFLSLTCFGQTKVLFHEFEVTTSNYNIIRWNIPPVNLPQYHIIELVDKKGRVVDLKFMDRNTFNNNRTCFMPVWIKFSYPNDTTIIENNLDSDGKYDCDLECGIPSQIIYYISPDQMSIRKTAYKCLPDTIAYLKYGFTREEIANLIPQVEEGENADRIEEYEYSFAKLKGIFPVSKDYNPNPEVIRMMGPIGIEIRKALKKEH